MRRSFLALATFVVAGLTASSVQADDDAIAQHIYQQLKMEQDAGNLRGYRVDMRVESGTVWFEGHVSTADQEMLILRTAQRAGRMGVVQVVDDIDVMPQPAAPMAMTEEAPMKSIRESVAQEPALPVSWTQQATTAPYQYAGSTAIPTSTTVMPQQPQQTTPTAVSQTPVAVNAVGTPLPVAYSGSVGITTDNPQMPGYAWPAYASHPNYAAVQYPRQYSASAWPYIGPFYPYPQVPLGWRRVTLEWDDGWWYLDFDDRQCCGH